MSVPSDKIRLRDKRFTMRLNVNAVLKNTAFFYWCAKKYLQFKKSYVINAFEYEGFYVCALRASP